LPDYASKTPNSRIIYGRARKVLPAGVSYGIRYFEPYPFYTSMAKGSKLYDVDGNEYVDFWLGHSALILGHGNQVVLDAVTNQLQKGTHYGTCHELEVELAEQVVKMVPNAEMVRFTNSGTEANMYAVRLARAYSGRTKIAKFEGGWHGGYDALQVGVKYPFDLPESAGLTAGATKDTIILPFNNLEAVRKRLSDEKVACIMIEPVLGAGGGVPAEKGFLQGLREHCDKKGILLIFDEVITGFRLAPGGAQQYYGVKADITVFGKILGGGFPVGAFSGPAEMMELLDTVVHQRPNFSFQGGTFVANPVTMVAGLATLKLLEDGTLIDRLNRTGAQVRKELSDIFDKNKLDVQLTGEGSIFNTHFTKEAVSDAIVASNANRKELINYNQWLIANGLFLLPTHNGVLSTQHSEADIEKLCVKTEEYAKHTH
jgi:glutamate-1-semialdehyde 2,1-aminomutase